MFGFGRKNDQQEAFLMAVRELKRELDLLHEEHEALKQSFRSFRARVYARTGRTGDLLDTPAPTPAAPSAETKAQYRERLMREGRLNARIHPSPSQEKT